MTSLFNFNTNFSITDLGILTALVTIIVEVLKQIVPKKFPTQILTLIISLILTIGTTVFYGSPTADNVFVGTLFGFIIAFISMKGFDELKEVFERFNLYTYEQYLNKREKDDDSSSG